MILLMSGYINKVTLVGNIGQDPVIRSTNEGKEIASLTLATSDYWKDRVTGEKKERTEWHRIVVFNENLVNVIKNYVKKGSKLYIEGSLQTRKWVDSGGIEKYTTEILLQNYSGTLIMLDSRNKSDFSAESSDSSTSQKSQFNHDDLDDEIPF
jgi:single-strand DNA-binding protein